MALHYKSRGLVIKKSDIGEADRIFRVFTKDFGKIEISGRAIRKVASKLKAGLDIFFLSDVEFIQGKTYKTLTDSFPVSKFNKIKKDLSKLKTAYKIAEAVDVLVGGEEKDEKIWNLLNETMERLEEDSASRKNYQSFYNYFIWNLFSELGYHPQLYKCSVCLSELNPSYIYFSSPAGGAVCINCNKTGKRVNADTIKIIRLILKKDWGTISKLNITPFSKKLFSDTTKDFYSHILCADSEKI